MRLFVWIVRYTVVCMLTRQVCGRTPMQGVVGSSIIARLAMPVSAG